MDLTNESPNGANTLTGVPAETDFRVGLHSIKQFGRPRGFQNLEDAVTILALDGKIAQFEEFAGCAGQWVCSTHHRLQHILM